MTLYKPGDKVIVRQDLDEVTAYYMATPDDKLGTYAVDEMLEFAGRTVTIFGMNPFDRYYIVEDNQMWSWSDAMFICIEPEDEYIDPVDFSDIAALL